MTGSTITGRILRSAVETPDAPAVVAGDTVLSYAELIAAAQGVRAAIAELSLPRESLVGVSAARDERYVVGALGIMLAGCCYVPLDPKLPDERLRGLIDDAGIGFVLAGPDTAPLFQELGANVLSPVAGQPAGNDAEPGSLAYALFTSGSTGRPKLVGIEHRSVCALIDGFDSVGPPRTTVVSSTVCPFSFDVSVWETYSALTTGGTVHLLPDKIAADPEALAAELVGRRITTAYLPPVGLEFLIDELRRAGEPRLERVLVGAEPIPLGTLARLQEVAPKLTIVNAYGPTEATVCSTFHVFAGAAEPDRRTPIGTAVPGWSVRVVDDNLHAVPAGEIGEIVVGGVGLARGYIGAPELTAARFVTGPDGRRWYRTGDLGRWLLSGDLEFAGRLDDQVKIRGFRVELGEIETALSGRAGVRAAVAMVWPGAAGTRLVAFVEGVADGAELRRDLTTVLPDYMVPARVFVVDRFPLTVNAKVDRRALLARADNSGHRAETPATDTRGRIAALWSEVLGVDQVGAHDNFFELGGDSRLAMVLVWRVLTELGDVARPTELLRCHTVADMTARVGAPRTEHRAAGPGDVAPLSFGQEGLWRLQRLNPTNHAFAIPIAFRVLGSRADELSTALRETLVSHEAFVLELSADDSGPWQRKAPEFPPVAVHRDATTETLDGDLRAAFERMAREIAPLVGRPWRAEIHSLAADDHVVLIVCHHVMVDGHSVPLLHQDLVDALAGGTVPERHGPTAFATAQRQRVGDAEWEQDRGYWQETLSPPPDALDLPLDRPRHAQQSGSGRTLRRRLSEGGGTNVAALAKRCNTTPFVVVLAAAGCLAHRYSGQRDFVISIPAAVDRLRPELADAVGYFVNVLPVRFDIDPGAGFAALVAATARRLDDAIAHGTLPYEALIPGSGSERLGNARSFTRFVVAQHVTGEPQSRSETITVTEQQFETGTAKYELSLFVEERPDGTWLRWEYDDELIDPSTMAAWHEAMARLVDEVGADPDQPVGSVDLLTDHDRAIIAAANNTTTSYPAEASLTDLFDEQVRLRPDAVALETSAGTMSYRELSERATRLAAAVRSHLSGPETPVVVFTGRSVEFVVGVLAVLKAGGSYVPVDARNPADRLRRLCDLVGAHVAVSTQDKRALLPPAVTVLDPADGTDDAPAPFRRRADSRAYVMFTSGSTGAPKGVEIVDRSIVRLVRGQTFAEFGAHDTFVLASSLAFDAATLELWGPLLNGGRLVVPDDGTVYDPRELAGVIGRHRVTAGFFNPSVFRSMLEARPDALRGMHTILIGGEAVPSALVVQAAKSLDHRVLVNGYGPTENTTFSCCHRLDELPTLARSVPIGRPIANSAAMVVDAGFGPVPVGVVGEIVVGGAGLARGYLGAAELTAARFVTGPDGRRWYRTGDLGRWLPTGVIEFVGRHDDQVKIRGFRIELGEIENALGGCAGVRAAVAMTWPGAASTRLVAFVEGAVDGTAVRRELTTTLPDYMVPARVLVVDRFPLTANAKVDRAALLALADRQSRDTETGVRAAPVTDTQSRLAVLWAEVLGMDRIGVHDNFFDLGGDSRTLVLLTERIRRQFKEDLRVVDVMGHPSVAGLSRLLDADGGSSDLAVRVNRRVQNRRRRQR